MDKKNKGKMVEEDDTKELKPMFTCAICFKILDIDTAIALTDCLHRFCWKCISGKIIKDDWKSCLVCFADLGSQPLENSSFDKFGQTFFPEQEVVKTEFETSEASSSSSYSSEDSSSSSDSSGAEAPEQEDMEDVNPSVHANKKYKVTKE